MKEEEFKPHHKEIILNGHIEDKVLYKPMSKQEQEKLRVKIWSYIDLYLVANNKSKVTELDVAEIESLGSRLRSTRNLDSLISEYNSPKTVGEVLGRSMDKTDSLSQYRQRLNSPQHPKNISVLKIKKDIFGKAAAEIEPTLKALASTELAQPQAEVDGHPDWGKKLEFRGENVIRRKKGPRTSGVSKAVKRELVMATVKQMAKDHAEDKAMLGKVIADKFSAWATKAILKRFGGR